MNSLPRLYQHESDLQKMCALLQTGYAAQTDAYYIHPGELKICLFNWLNASDPWQFIYLWDDQIIRDRLLGWVLLSTSWCAFDVYVQPELRGSAWANEVHSWAEEKSVEKAREQGYSQIWRMLVAEADTPLIEYLLKGGFRRQQQYDYVEMTCALDHVLHLPTVPEGYILRQVGESDAASRAAAQYAAFQIEDPWEEYFLQYRTFMASPGYTQGYDWIIVAPDGSVASFCIVWPDAVTRTGLFEPVGTHPDFQRRGLGKTSMMAGLHQLQSLGMRSVRTCVRTNNMAAIKLYESVEFRVSRRLLTFRKAI